MHRGGKGRGQIKGWGRLSVVGRALKSTARNRGRGKRVAHVEKD